ncbi:MAG TPA: 16S rRNA (cytidine(1402)-2'-O)-methyltransferase [Actinomycetota bacterium]
MSGILSIVGTPIGNLDDLSIRAAATLARADVIACEDTRVTGKLMARVRAMHPDAHRARLVACHARNERERIPELVRAVRAGSRVALVTDAGMPGLSDPGRRVVEACADAGVRIEVIPGPSAVPAALIASGLPTARFVFEGFLPRAGTARRARLAALAGEERTVVLFEAPHRIAATLADLAAALGPRRAALARELTKLHEEVLRGTLPELADAIAGTGARGEMTLVIEGASPAASVPAPADLAGAVAARVAGGQTKRDAIASVAASAGVPKRAVYQAVLDRPES